MAEIAFPWKHRLLRNFSPKPRPPPRKMKPCGSHVAFKGQALHYLPFSCLFFFFLGLLIPFLSLSFVCLAGSLDLFVLSVCLLAFLLLSLSLFICLSVYRSVHLSISLSSFGSLSLHLSSIPLLPYLLTPSTHLSMTFTNAHLKKPHARAA